jgi:O-antigen/teichoic acid export membrane protein
MPSFRALAKDVFVYGITGGLSRGATLLLLPVLTRAFSPAEYGLADIVATFTSLLAIAVSVILEAAVARMWFDSGTSRKELVSTTLGFILCLGTATVLAVAVARRQLAVLLLHDISAADYLVVGAVIAACTALFGVVQIALRMDRRIWSYNAAIATQTVGLMVLTGIFVFRLRMGLYGLFVAQMISTILGLLVSLAMIRRYLGVRTSTRLLRNALAYSAPLLPAGGAAWINAQTDRVILLMTLGLGAVGVFGAAAKIALITALVVTAYQLAWTPVLMGAIEDPSKAWFFRRALNYYGGAMVAFGVALVAASKELIAVAAPPEYHAGYALLPWLVGAQILQGSANITNIGMLITKRTGGNSIAAWMGAVLNVLIAVVLIPRIGLAGAAIGMFISAFVFTTTLMVFSMKVAAVRFDRVRAALIVGLYLIGSTAMVAIGQHVESEPRSLALRAAALILLLVILAFVVDARATIGDLTPRSQRTRI